MNLQLKLPKSLREISGLALLSDTQLLAIADEKAKIFVIDIAAETAEPYSQLGDKPIKGDFEGIAVTTDHLYLITSDGQLLWQPLHSDNNDYLSVDTTLGDECEIEGLSSVPGTSTLMILCKTPHRKALKGHLVLYAWDTNKQARNQNQDLHIPLANLGLKKFHPSGLSYQPDGSSAIIVAARQARFVEISQDGKLIRSGKLPKAGQHRQTEGIVIDSQGKIYLADEGGKGKGTLTQYVTGI